MPSGTSRAHGLHVSLVCSRDLRHRDRMRGYFDYNATTPVSEAAVDAWREASVRHWHNASSLYREGAAVSRLLEEAQSDVADWLGAEDPERVIFDSGATEANNAILSHVARTRPGRVAVSAVEHPSIAECARGVLGGRVDEIPVDADGVLQLEAMRAYLAREADVALVSVMAANNESGVIQPWREVLSLCRERGIPFHCDAAQWIGKLPARGLGECDYVTGSAHKFGGPKGAGFLLVPEEARDFRSLLGGPQQEGRRAGTENYPAVAGMLAAWRRLECRLPECAASGLQHRTWAEGALEEQIPGLRIVGAGAVEGRLWNTVLFILPEHDNRRWLTRLNRRGFAVSTGSACSSGKENPSRVLQAIGEDFAAMGRTIRVSSGWDTARSDWEGLVAAFAAVHAELRSSGEQPRHTGKPAASTNAGEW